MNSYKLINILFFSVAISNVISTDFMSNEYQSLKASEKLDLLWEKIIENKQGIDYHQNLLEIMKETDLNISLTWNGDVMPEGRKKFIHTVGAVAKAKFIATPDSPYTGRYKGSNTVIVRLSSTGEPGENLGINSFLPSIALKFLKDGEPSDNLVAGLDLKEEHDSWNFFRGNLNTWNHLNPDDIDPSKKRKGNAKFSQVTPWVSSTGTRNLALQPNSEDEKFPFRIIFKSPESLKEQFSDDDYIFFINQLLEVKPGLLYEVYAIEQPGCEEKKIGVLNITTPLTTSYFGDTKLFFQHIHPEIDYDIFQEWNHYRDTLINFTVYRGLEFPKSICPYANNEKKSESDL